MYTYGWFPWSDGTRCHDLSFLNRWGNNGNSVRLHLGGGSQNCCFWTVMLEKTLESPFDYKEIQPVHPQGDQSWVLLGRTDAEAETPILWPPQRVDSLEELTHWKRPWCWEGLGAGEGDDRGWDGWMASPTRCTLVWVNSGNWWWTGRPGVLRFMGSQMVGHDWGTELNWTELMADSHWGLIENSKIL